MALDIKQFAIVARATNAIYMYVTTDSVATITTANYFNSKDLSGYVKVNDVIIAVANNKLAMLRVTAVVPATGAITVATAIAESSGSSS